MAERSVSDLLCESYRFVGQLFRGYGTCSVIDVAPGLKLCMRLHITTYLS